MAREQGAEVVLIRPARPAGPSLLLRALKAPEAGLALGLVLVLGVLYLLDRQGSFFSAHTLRTLFHNAAMMGVLAVGAAIVIIAGGIDLSVGSVVALSSILSALLVTRWLPALAGIPEGTALPGGLVLAAVALTLLAGLVLGMTHAGMINYLRLPPFIATLATMAGLRSLAKVLCENKPITVSNPVYRMLGNDYRWSLAIFVAVALAASLMMGLTVVGRHLYALGGNEPAARLSGLRTRRLKTFAYGLAGMLSALGGILFTGKGGQGEAAQMGIGYELFAITAAVVGGCSLAGGVGSIRGTVLGLILIQCVIKGTGILVRWIDSTTIEGLVLGTVVILAVALNQRVRGRAA